MSSPIAVFHPGTQHSYQTALAFQDADRLAWYATAIFYDPGRWPYRIAAWLPSGLRRRVEHELRRRHHPGLDARLVRTIGACEWTERAAMRLGLRAVEHYANEWGNRRFSRRVAAMALADGIRCVWGFNTASLPAFSILKPRGVTCVLEHTTGHPRAWNRLLADERPRVGEDFDPYPRPYPDADLARAEAELAAADRIVCGSPFACDTLVAEGVPADRVSVVAYGADTDRFAPSGTSGPLDRVRLLFVGHFGLGKGARYLIDALQQMGPRPGLSLTIVGKQTVPAKYLAPIADRVRIVPHVPHDEMAAVYRDADVFVLPTLFEGSSVAVYRGARVGPAGRDDAERRVGRARRHGGAAGAATRRGGAGGGARSAVRRSGVAESDGHAGPGAGAGISLGAVPA